MIEEEFVKELLKKKKRADGRKFDEFRKIQIKEAPIEKAEGSALVKLGNTWVAAGIKLNVGTPFPDTPDQGILIVNAEFSPIASPEFEPGPPTEDAIELARVVDRCLREGKAIDLSKLVLKEGEKVWCVFVDIHILNHDGNLLDAAALASMLALKNTRMPKLDEEFNVIRGEYEGKLQVEHVPLLVSICKFGNDYLIDPTYLEEKVIDGKLTFGIREDEKICAIQKQGKAVFDFDEIEKIIDLAILKSKELRKFYGN